VSPALHPLRLAIAQINPTVGDLTGNAELAVEWIGRASEAGADLVVLPELTVTGYPPEDLLLKRHFLSTAEEVLPTIAAAADGIVALVGTVCRDPALHNALAVLADGAIRGLYRKVLLPNYGVFDERRYF
jgi:NAD+ synthase (glutamine-hydrolysing)